MCPASMFANSRTVSANGLVNMPRISTGIMIGSSHTGSPGGIRLWKWPTIPYFEMPAHCCAANETSASASVTAMFPVEVAEKGKQAHERRRQDEEEEAAQQRRELAPVAVADVRLGHLVADEDDQALDRGADPARDPAAAVAAHGELRDHDHQDRHQEQEQHVLRGEDPRNGPSIA